MHNINIYLPNEYISLSIQDFNNLIYLIFQKKNENKLITLIELMNEYNKILFVKNNIHKFSKTLPLCFKINLNLKNIIYFTYEEQFYRLPYLDLELVLNKNKRYPNYSLKINNENFLLFKLDNNFLVPVINRLEILNYKETSQNNYIKNYNDILKILDNYTFDPKIYNDEFMDFHDKILNNIIPCIISNNIYFLFFNNNLFLVNEIIYTKNKFNKITNIQLKVKNIVYNFG